MWPQPPELEFTDRPVTLVQSRARSIAEGVLFGAMAALLVPWARAYGASPCVLIPGAFIALGAVLSWEGWRKAIFPARVTLSSQGMVIEDRHGRRSYAWSEVGHFYVSRHSAGFASHRAGEREGRWEDLGGGFFWFNARTLDILNGAQTAWSGGQSAPRPESNGSKWRLIAVAVVGIALLVGVHVARQRGVCSFQYAEPDGAVAAACVATQAFG